MRRRRSFYSCGTDASPSPSIRYPAVHVLPFRDLRKITYRGYLIFYQSTAAEVEIVHILQGSRDWEALLRNEAGPN
jgi:plasmid stabilization system protein ParE